MTLLKPLLAVSLSAALSVSAFASSVTIEVQADRPGANINPAMWGIFFEDINFGADGGLYAELVKNRSFEFPNPLMGWSKVDGAGTGTAGSVAILDQDPFASSNPHYLRLKTQTSTWM